jgi:hypothetical protein
MSLVMTVEERQAFLAQVHVAVVAVAGEDGRAPLAVPVWYDYRPGGDQHQLPPTSFFASAGDSDVESAVNAAGRPGLVDYRPGGEVSLITERDSRKTTLIRLAGRITLCVQGTELPYQYVSAEGPITAIEDTVTLEQRRAMASRYFGPEGADAYLDTTAADATERMVRILMRPEHWLTRDYTKTSS